MLNRILTKFIGTHQERELKRLTETYVEPINALEAQCETLSDEALRAKTIEFRERLEAGETIDDLLVEAFAVVREASRRTTGLRHYDVQLIGGVVLHRGVLTEMTTGEGKTLVATLPAYLNALDGRSVHIITVNDYLAQRDREWMGPVHEFLGLTVGAIQNDMDDADHHGRHVSRSEQCVSVQGAAVFCREKHPVDVVSRNQGDFGDGDGIPAWVDIQERRLSGRWRVANPRWWGRVRRSVCTHHQPGRMRHIPRDRPF